MKTSLNSPNIADMVKLGFNLVDIADHVSELESIQDKQPPWDTWFFCPTRSGNQSFIECWHKAE